MAAVTLQQHETIRLIQDHGFSPADLAMEAGVSRSAIYTRLSRARQKGAIIPDRRRTDRRSVCQMSQLRDDGRPAVVGL